MICFNKGNSLIKRMQKYRIVIVNLIINEYIEKHKHTCFTIGQINKSLTSLLPWGEVPSWEYIRNYVETPLNLSFKRVSWQTKKNFSRDLLINRLNYINLINIINQVSYIVVQIDEFWVGRNMFPSMVWTEKCWSGYALNDMIQSRWFVIAAIHNFSFETATISKINTNGIVFENFWKFLLRI